MELSALADATRSPSFAFGRPSAKKQVSNTLIRPSLLDFQQMTVAELKDVIRKASDELANRATIVQSTENRQRCTSENKRSLSKAKSTDDMSSQQYGSLSVILNIPGLNTRLLSFSSATDLSRLSQCNRALQSMIDESFDLELERDVHLLQQLGMPSEKIAKYRGQWARLKNGEAKIVCYMLCEGDLTEGNPVELDFEHRSMVRFLRQLLGQKYAFRLYLNDPYDSMHTKCVECGKVKDEPEDCRFVTPDMSASLSEGQFKCVDCFKLSDPSLMALLLWFKQNGEILRWEFTENGPFDSNFMEDPQEYFDDARASPCYPYTKMSERMTMISGMWLVNLCLDYGCGVSLDWYVKLEDKAQ